MFKVEVKIVPGHVAVLTLYGGLVAGETSGLRNSVQELLGQGCREIVIDLSRVDKIDCAGFGELTRSFTDARDGGALLSLFNPIQRIYEVLRITKLLSVFPMVRAEHFEESLQSSFATTLPEASSENVDATHLQPYADGTANWA